MTAPILFFGKSRPYFEFSNWYVGKPFEAEGKLWPTSEHWFMALKTLDEKAKEKIRKAKTPREAKDLAGPNGIIKLRDDWEDIKFDMMVRVLYEKFDQNIGLKVLLLSTGDAVLHEDCPDPFWGGGPNYPDGQDLLGKALMKVRETLRVENLR